MGEKVSGVGGGGGWWVTLDQSAAGTVQFSLPYPS